MKDLELIQKLRAQVIDDDHGRIRCKPCEKAKEYFRLSVKIGKCLEPEAQLYNEVMTPIWKQEDHADYTKWASLFDLLEEGVKENSIAPLSQTLLERRCGWALKSWDAEALKPPLSLLLLEKEIWGGKSPNPQEVWMAVGSKAGQYLEMHPPSGEEEGRMMACVRALWEIHRQTCEDGGETSAVSEAMLGWLEGGQGEGLLDRVIFAVASLAEAREPAILADRATKFFLNRIRQVEPGKGNLEGMLKEARKFLGALGSGDRYRKIFVEAVEDMMSANSQAPLDETHRSMILASHPDPKPFAPFLEWVWEAGEAGLRPDGNASDDPKWRQLILSLCRAESDESRMGLVREWIMERVKGLLVSQPGRVKPFLDCHAARLPSDCPNQAEFKGLVATVQALDGVDEFHLKAMAAMGRNPETQNCILRWCRLFEDLGEVVPALDRNEWQRIGLDLLKASQAWNPAVMIQTTQKLKHFGQLMIMGNPGCAQAAQQIVACENELLNDLMIRAVLKAFPVVDDEAVAQLQSSGLGINLRKPDFEGLRKSVDSKSVHPGE